MGAKRKLTPEEIEKNRKLELLKQFDEIMSKQERSLVEYSVAIQIWKIWQQYTGRTDRWRGCGTCLTSKIRFLTKQSKIMNPPVVEVEEEKEEKENNDNVQD